MAGLIEEQMDVPMAQEQGAPMDMGQDLSMMDQPEDMMMDEGEGPDENDPAFQTALQYAMQALYENDAARDVAQALQAAAQDPAGALAETAYEIVSVVDERTDGQVPDELLILLTVTILQEVADIGEAAGVDVSPSNLAEAFKRMLLHFLGEQGLDTTELEQAMAEVDPSMFEQAANAEV